MPSSGFQTCALDRKSTRLNSSHTIISYAVFCLEKLRSDRKSTRLNSSHTRISYAVFCLKKKQRIQSGADPRRIPGAVTGELRGAQARARRDRNAPLVGRARRPRGRSAESLCFFLRIGGPRKSSPFPCPALFR